MEGFTDLDTSADVDTSRSTSGYVMTYAGGRPIVVIEAVEVRRTINHGNGVEENFLGRVLEAGNRGTNGRS